MRPRMTKSRLSRRRLTALVEEAIIDAYGESEQRVGLLTMLQEHLQVPFTTSLLGVTVRVTGVDLNDAEEIVAVCRRVHSSSGSLSRTCYCQRRRRSAGSGSKPTGTGHGASARSRRPSSDAYTLRVACYVLHRPARRPCRR